jgi:hypothetical protein
MHDHQITAQISKRFVRTTLSDLALPVAENVLERQFTGPAKAGSTWP